MPWPNSRCCCNETPPITEQNLDFYLHYIWEISKVVYNLAKLGAICLRFCKYTCRFHTAFAQQSFLGNKFANFLDHGWVKKNQDIFPSLVAFRYSKLSLTLVKYLRKCQKKIGSEFWMWWGNVEVVNVCTDWLFCTLFKVGVNHGIFHVYHFWNFLIFKCTWVCSSSSSKNKNIFLNLSINSINLKMSIYLSISKMCSSLFRGEIKLARV